MMNVGAALCTCLALSAMLRADVLEVKTGEHIEGTFQKADAQGVVMEVAGQKITVPLEKVSAIFFGSRSSAPQVPDPIDSLKALRSVTGAGVTYPEYSRRVLDAKILVDKYLNTEPSGDRRNSVALSMRFYEIALQLWSNKISSNANSFEQNQKIGIAMQNDQELRSCARLVDDVDANKKSIIKTMKAKNTDVSNLLSYVMADRLPVFWSCAEVQIDHLDQLKQEPKR